MCQPMWIGLENIKPESVSQPNGWAWEDFSHNDFTNNWFNPNITPNEPVCNKSLAVAYITHVQSAPDSHGYYWYNVGSWETRTFSCVHAKPHSTQSTSIVTTTAGCSILLYLYVSKAMLNESFVFFSIGQL